MKKIAYKFQSNLGCIPAIILYIIFSYHGYNLSAQTLSVAYFDADGNGNTGVWQLCPPMDADDDMHTTVPWMQGGTTWYGVNHDYYAGRGYQTKVNACGHVRANNSSHLSLDGDGSRTLLMDWHNTAGVYSLTDVVPYGANAVNNFWFDVEIEIMPGGGYANGDPVNLYFYFFTFGAGITVHDDDALKEDVIIMNNQFLYNGTNLLGNGFDFLSPPGIQGFNTVENTTILNLQIGDVITLSFNSNQSSRIAPPPFMNNIRDFAKCHIKGYLLLSFDSIPTPPQYQPNYYPRIEFSVDIGSDAEFSDPNQNGNEVFDPGDAYLMRGPYMLSPFNGVKDDATIFGFDPVPDLNNPLTAVPCGIGPFQPFMYFNINGMDNMQVSLATLSYGPGFPSIGYFNDSLILLANHFLVSYDDDGPENWSYNSFGFQSVPVNSQSPLDYDTYGKTQKADEVVAVDLDAYMIPATPFTLDSLWSEWDIHPNLFPNPDLLESEDNDVNALNYFPNQYVDGFFYFTVDSEATFNHPLVFGALNPGSIYQLLSPGNFVEVVNPVFHLGLPDSTDIDAFTFGWVYDIDNFRLGLALLFSVDVNDWTTPADESGGKDPAMIYFSFLNGTHHEFMAEPLKDNIDALTIVPGSFNGYTLPLPPSTSCDAPTQLTVAVNPTDATLMWTEPIPVPAFGYEIELTDQNGITVLTDVVPAGTVLYFFAGLNPNFTYTATVRSVCAGGLLAEELITFITPLLNDIAIDNINFSNGYDDCFEAASTIVMSNSMVESGADVVLVAGHVVQILPETHIKNGAKFIAAINNGGTWCSSFKQIMSVDDEALEDQLPVSAIKTTMSFRVYPNPTSGSFTLDLMDYTDHSRISIEVFGILGERIIDIELLGEPRCVIDLSGREPGMYFIRVVRNNEIGVEKLILR